MPASETHDQDLTAQRDALARLGVSAERTYVDHGLTGANRERPGLREALAACRGGDTLVLTKLDRLARSLPDAREILDDLTRREVKLSIGGSVHDPTDPVGRLLFNVLAMVALTPGPDGIPGRQLLAVRVRWNAQRDVIAGTGSPRQHSCRLAGYADR
jgi:Resolvase, N terminal domain